MTDVDLMDYSLHAILFCFQRVVYLYQRFINFLVIVSLPVFILMKYMPVFRFAILICCPLTMRGAVNTTPPLMSTIFTSKTSPILPYCITISLLTGLGNIFMVVV